MYKCTNINDLISRLVLKFDIIRRDDLEYIFKHSGEISSVYDEYFITYKEYDKVIDLIYYFASIDKAKVVTKELIIEFMSVSIRPCTTLNYDNILETLISNYL